MGGSDGQPSRRAVARRLATIVAGLTALVVLAVSGAGYALLTYSTDRVRRVPVFDGLTGRPAPAPTSAQTYLVVGSDQREGLSRQEAERLRVGRATQANGGGRRSDTMLLVHISADRQRALIVSLPRDSYVTIPEHRSSDGRLIPPHGDKLNAAFAYGGAPLLVRTVEQATGVRLNHYVEVNFAGFVDVVNALGGVTMCVPHPIDDPKAHLTLAAGTHHLDGVESLKYVRARYFDGQGDLGRMHRQQEFAGAMLRQAMSAGVLLNPVRLTRFLNATLDAVGTDPQLNRADVVTLATQLRSIHTSAVTMLTVPLSNQDYRPPELDGASAVVWDRTLATQLFEAIRHDQPLPRPARPTTVEVPPGQISVSVRNGTTLAGLAGRASTDLADAGFRVTAPPANAPRHDLVRSVIRYDPRWDRSVKTVAAALPGAVLEQVPGLGAQFEIWIGTSYKGVSPVAVASATPSPSGGFDTRTAADNPCAPQGSEG